MSSKLKEELFVTCAVNVKEEAGDEGDIARSIEEISYDVLE